MRETSSDIMEDAMSEDNMMDCGVGAEGMDELEDSVDDVPISSTSTIRDAAQRLLNLLTAGELNDDFLSSSEDEGVEVDLDDNDDDDDDEDDDDDDDDDVDGPPNSRLLQQLAVSLAEELKYAKLQNNSITLKKNTQSNRTMISTSVDSSSEQLQRMDITDDGNEIFHGQSSILGNKYGIKYHDNYQHDENNSKPIEMNSRISNSQMIHSLDCDDFFVSNKRCRIDECQRSINEEKDKINDNCEIPTLWTAGWDTCATEAVRYLIDVEGLDPTHPTVLALKSHLEIQRNSAFLQYTSST